MPVAKKSDTAIKGMILDELYTKDRIFERRMNVLNFQSNVLRDLINIASDKNNSYSAGYGYGSGIFHKLANFLSGVKLFPTFLSFRHEQTRIGEEQMVRAENITDLHLLMRKKGKYKKASQDAISDLIRGECFIRRYIKMDVDSEPVVIAYEAVPFNQMRWKYGSQSIIRVVNISHDDAVKRFGEKTVKKVKKVKLYQDDNRWYENKNPTIERYEQEKEEYSYIHYVNEASREEYEVLGDTIITKNVGEDYIDQYDGETFNQYERRVFYESVEERNFGYGVLDLIFPLLRADTTHGNALIKRSIDDADPLTLVSADDPSKIQREYYNHLANRAAGKSGNIFFMQGRGTDSKLSLEQVSSGANSSMFQFVEDFVINRVSMLTDVNLRSLLEFAPTEAQDLRRAELQDKVALAVLQRNKATDAEFAQEDLMFLLNTDTKFHDKEVYFKQSSEALGGDTDDVDAIRDKDGELPPEKLTVREFIKTIDDLEYDITPRLDGVLDDNTRGEINAQRNDLMLLQPGTPAYSKAIVDYFEKTNPKLRIRDVDVNPPMPEIPEALPPM